MPLRRIPGPEAVATRKANSFAWWGTRSTENRVEPIARPEFYPGFTLEPGEKIFTIGSCFARHVEDELMKRQYQIPVRELMGDPLFADLSTDVLNNYGTPSIANELSWAFDPATPFVPQDHLLEVKPGKFVDLHFPPVIAPATWEVATGRRKALQKLMRLSANCRVIIITLGLSEVWFDKASGYYLNDTVRPSVLRLYPDRFELHVLSYQDSFEYLDKALQLLRRVNRNDIRIVLTVSPVPLAATHRAMDVIVANTYSKSMLRAVAEEICEKYDWIDYYPSYESVTLSDRKLSWEADLIHVTGEMVAMNVGRMLDRYQRNAGTLQSARDRIATAGSLVAEELSGAAVERGGEYAAAFFAEFGAWSEKSPGFAMHHARFLQSQGDDEGVLRVLSFAQLESEPMAVGLLRAEAQLHLGRAADAVATLEPLIHNRLRSQPIWELLIKAHAANDDADGAIAVTQSYMAAMGYAKSWAYLNLARAFRESDPSRATYFYEMIVEDFLDSDQWTQYEIADYLAQNRKFDAARRMLAHLKPEHADLERQVSTLNELLAVK
jgi:hypothetical protein